MDGLMVLKLVCSGIAPCMIIRSVLSSATIPEADSVWPRSPLTEPRERVSFRIDPPNTLRTLSYSAGSLTGVLVQRALITEI
jgi:hypothetical protein